MLAARTASIDSRVPLVEPLATPPTGGRAERLLLPATFVTSLGNGIQLVASAILVFTTAGSALSVGWLAAAMIDRLVHHAEVISMKGDSYRLKDRDLGRVPAATKAND
nr:ATP-binding protein [Micromonospora inositola]